MPVTPGKFPRTQCVATNDLRGELRTMTLPSLSARWRIVWVLKKNNWSPAAEIAAFLQVLAGPDCNTKDAIGVGLDALHELWNESLSPATQQLTSDLLLRALFTGRDFQQVLRALEVMNSGRSAIWTPAMARIQQVIRSWRPSRGRRH